MCERESLKAEMFKIHVPQNMTKYVVEIGSDVLKEPAASD
jgi:hypothetical protein